MLQRKQRHTRIQVGDGEVVLGGGGADAEQYARTEVAREADRGKNCEHFQDLMTKCYRLIGNVKKTERRSRCMVPTDTRRCLCPA